MSRMVTKMTDISPLQIGEVVLFSRYIGMLHALSANIVV